MTTHLSIPIGPHLITACGRFDDSDRIESSPDRVDCKYCRSSKWFREYAEKESNYKLRQKLDAGASETEVLIFDKKDLPKGSKYNSRK